MPVALVSSALSQNTIHIPADQPTIQAGINAASNGDTVLVAPGTYYENIDFKGKAIIVTSSAGSATTIIDGSLGLNPAVVFRNHEGRTSTLSGFTIQGGGYEGAPAPPNNYGISGILIYQGMPTIANNVITHNHCNSIESSGSSPLIANNEIDHTLDPQGRCTFAGGSAVWLSGSLHNYNGGNNVTEPPAVVIGNTIQNNTDSGHEDAGGNGGAGIAIWGAYAQVIGNTIRNNSTLGDGGAILAFNTDTVSIVQNLIYGNRATTDGALSLAPPEQSLGPFIGVVASNTISGNTQTASKGGEFGDVPPTEVYLSGNLGQWVLVNNIIVGNGPGTVAVSCGTVYAYLSLTPLVFDHDDIYNPGGTLYGGTCSDQTGTYGNISADPQFVNPGSGDYQLASGSPAVDAGNNSALPNLAAISVNLPTDLAGAPRIQDATGKHYPVIDIGAYEFGGQQDSSPTTILVKPSAYETSGGSAITLTATVSSSAGVPAGTLDFQQDGANFTTGIIDSSGNVTVSTAGLTPGVHAFTATYAGKDAFPPSVSVKIYVLVDKYATRLTITSAPNPSSVNQPVTFTIKLTSPDGAVLGPVLVSDSNTSTTLATLNPDASGSASFITSTLTLGTHPIQAIYSGDATHSNSSAVVGQVVTSGLTNTSTSLTSSLNPASNGQSVTFTANVTNTPNTPGSPTGSIAFSDGTTLLATQALSAVNNTTATASFSTSALGAGPHIITANYVPSSGFSGSSATFTEVINGLVSATALSASPSPTLFGQPVTLSATVTGSPTVPTGSLTFYDGTAALSTVPLDASGHANLTTATLTVGTHTLTAVYAGNSTYAASTSAAVLETINPLPADFTITLATPNITIRTQHHTTTTVTLTSVNGFTDTLAISCANLPQYLTGRPTPGSTTLASGGSATVSLYLDTDSVLGYARNTSGPLQDRFPSPIAWALLIAPITLFGCTRSRRNGRAGLRLLMIVLAFLPISMALSGCGELIISADIPPSVAPGTYMIPIIATGAASGISHTAQLTLQVTP